MTDSYLEKKYDVICSGGNLSSFVCGALLAKAGKRVLVIDDENISETNSLNFMGEPVGNFAFFPGDHESEQKVASPFGVVNSVMANLGLSSILAQDFRPLSQVLQILTPHYRLDVTCRIDRTLKNIEHELRHNGRVLGELLRNISHSSAKLPTLVSEAMLAGQVSQGDRVRWRRDLGEFYGPMVDSGVSPLTELIGKNFDSDEVRVCGEVLSTLLAALSYSSPQSFGAEQTIRSLLLLLRGQTYVVGGQRRLIMECRKIIESAGGKVSRGTHAQSLIVDNGTVSGLLLSSFEGVVNAKTVILASRQRSLYLGLPINEQDPVLSRAFQKLEISHWDYSLKVRIKKAAIPIGMAPIVAYVGSSDDPMVEENFFRVVALPDEGYGSGVVVDSDADIATLVVTCPIPFRASSFEYSYLRRLGGKIVQALSEIIPFLGDNIISISPDFRPEGIQGERAIAGCYPFEGGSVVSENLVRYYVRGDKNCQDFWALPWATPHGNLYFAGRAIWPSLGLYGEVLAAQKIYEDIQRPIR